MRIFNRIISHHTLSEAVACKINNKTVSDKTMRKLVKKISSIANDQEKVTALKSAFNIARNIKGKQARERISSLLESNINLVSAPQQVAGAKIDKLTESKILASDFLFSQPVSGAKVEKLTKSKGEVVKNIIEYLNSTVEVIEPEKLLSSQEKRKKPSELNGFKGDFVFDGEVVFKNFVSVEPGVLARGSAPHYTNNDNSQRLSEKAINFLKTHGFNLVVSLNNFELSEEEQKKLAKSCIEYIHIPKADYSTIDLDEILQTIKVMDGKNTYVYCGYGQGRTGLLVSAWQILNNKGALNDTTVETAGQLTILNDLDKKCALSKSINKLMYAIN